MTSINPESDQRFNSRSSEGSLSTNSSKEENAAAAYSSPPALTGGLASSASPIRSIDASGQSTANTASTFVAKILEKTRGPASSIGSSTSLVFRKVLPTQKQKEMKEILKTYSSMESYHIHMQTKKELEALKILYNKDSTVEDYQKALAHLNPIPESSNSSKQIANDLKAKIEGDSTSTSTGAGAGAVRGRAFSFDASIRSITKVANKDFQRSKSFSDLSSSRENTSSFGGNQTSHNISQTFVASPDASNAALNKGGNTQAATPPPKATAAKPNEPPPPPSETKSKNSWFKWIK
jgi:hypothetical protein